MQYAESTSSDPRIGTDELPHRSALLRAFREPSDPSHRKHRVLTAAHELVECHERRRSALQAAHALDAAPSRVAACSQLVDDIDEHRRELIAVIDDWVATNVAHRTGASLHTETLGAVIDRMAAKWIAAQQALGMNGHGSAPPPQVASRNHDADAHLQWTRLAELADGYQDLITDVVEHRRRLPVW
ncbi:DUF4254 domain-containing protein [Nocardia sp. XZ_19_385]|uniref:DUF4254 domain-containing protein n=1 Tax=Nocardia sp. XZ_19_385 TaxID=2769488 RepID=UPI00188F6938|nr:DUF4254 domain-containing protein [Nocardia sp. XZ_19_385]